MPSLDEMFATMSADADRVAAPALGAIEARGRARRRHTAAAATASLAALALVVAGIAAWGPRPPAEPVPPAQPGPVDFHSLVEVGPGYPISGHPTGVVTTVAGGRGYATWTSADSGAGVAAIDATTGLPRWRVTDLVGDRAGVLTLGGVLAVFGAPPAGQPSSQPPGVLAFAALDPADGSTLWRRSFAATQRLLPYQSVLVVADAADGTTIALDWRTGATRWTAHDPSGGLAYAAGMAAATPVDGPGDWVFADPRVVESGTDHVLRTYDATTGHLLSTRPAPPGGAGADSPLGYDGRLFSVRRTGPAWELFAVDPSGSAEPAPFYTSTQATSSAPVPVGPCGDHLLCVVDGHGIGGDEPATLVALDTRTGRVAWRAVTGDLEWFSAVGAKVLAGSTEGLVGLYGAQTQQTLVPVGQPGAVLRVDAGSVLVLLPAAPDIRFDSGTVQSTRVFGVAVATGEKVELGLVDVAPSSCSADTVHLVCGDQDGVRVWRFAGK